MIKSEYFYCPDIFYNMDSEKILFCYRDDELKKAMLLPGAIDMGFVATVPCSRKILGRAIEIRQSTVKKSIAMLYEQSAADYLWLEDSLCEFLQMGKMDLPDVLRRKWLCGIPCFHTLIFADDIKGHAIRFIEEKSDTLAAVCSVCYEKYVLDYEEIARKLFLKEGLVLQILTYEKIEKWPDLFKQEVLLKGRAALLDFDDRRAFWDNRLLKDMGYYSFSKEIGLFLDTIRKNRYNTLTK